MRKLIGFFLISTFLISCGGAKQSENSELTPSKETTNDKVEKDVRKLIKESTLSFRTDDNDKTNKLIESSVKQFGAYISESNNFNHSNEVGYDLKIRVPSDKFDALMDYILKKADIKELDNKSVQIKDVTEDFIDIQARIKVKKETEQKLTDLLKQAKNLTETLEIQKQLTELSADIESIEGRLKYLNDQVNYSTINLSFYENIKYSKRFFSDFGDALKDGIQIFLHLITALTYLWVVIIVFILIRWGLKLYKPFKKSDNTKFDKL